MKVGKIRNILRCSFEWKINKFFDQMEDINVIYESPDFEFDSAIWCLQLHPNGCKEDEISEWICLFLYKRWSSRPNHIYSFTFSMIDVNGKSYRRLKDNHREFNGNDVSCGWSKYLERTKLFNNMSNIAPEGVVIICCRFDLEYILRTPQEIEASIVGSTTVRPRQWENVITNMKDLFWNQENCDVIIQVKSQTFTAHRIILESRCEYFAAMFRHDVKESRSGIVEITDAEPEDFQEILFFIYCGEVMNFSTENVWQLYVLADKYDLKDLKQDCAKFIERTLCVETVCEVLYLADKYNKVGMKCLAKKFLSENRSNVLKTGKWKDFETENPVLAFGTIKSIFLDDESDE